MFLIDLKAGGRGQEVGGFFYFDCNRVGNSQEKKKPCREKLHRCPTLNTAELLDTGHFRLISATHFTAARPASSRADHHQPRGV